MPLMGFQCRKPVDLLAAEEIEQIHRATLEVLHRVGVVMGCDEALALLEAGGCRVDRGSGRVHFPAALVEECSGRCPGHFTIRARQPDFDLEIGGDRLYFQSHPGLAIADLETGERRVAVLEDIAPLVRLLDAQDSIHLPIMPTATLAGKPPEVMTEWVMAEVLRNTRKVTAGGVMAGCAAWIVRMAEVTGQQVYGQMNSVSPLRYSAEQIAGALDYVRAGHPICILPGPTVGANSPATLAGTLVLQTAEHLAGVVLVQLARPGAPLTLASYPHVLDMRGGCLSAGGVEVALLGAALAQIGRRYGIPTHPEFPMTDSKALDEQAGIEKAMAAVLLAQAGANLISNGGALEAERLWSPVQLVIDNEINAMVGRVLEGITVSDEALAVEVIDQVALPSVGNFLATRHTKKLWRREQMLPRLADRLGFEAWQAQGGRDMAARARELARETIKNHVVPPLAEEQDRELDRIVLAAERSKLGGS